MPKPKDDRDKLKAVLEAMAESVADASDEELLQDAKEEGRDPADTNAQVQKLLQKSVLEFKRKQRERADVEHNTAASAFSASAPSLVADAALRRQLLTTVFTRQAQLNDALKSENPGTMTDEDVEKMLEKLKVLGLVDLTEDQE